MTHGEGGREIMVKKIINWKEKGKKDKPVSYI
jgi:hypothetical protein